MLLGQSLVRRHPHSQIKSFESKGLCEHVILAFWHACHAQVALHMICKFNINNGQQRLNGVPAKSAADSVSQGGFPLGHQILKGALLKWH